MNSGEHKDVISKGKELWEALGRKPINNEQITEILQRGAPVNFREPNSKTERTALHVVVVSGEVDVMKILLHHGAQTNLSDRFGMSPLHLAAEKGDLQCVEVLLKNPGSPADPNERSQVTEKETPLQCAIVNKHRHVVRFLLENGANLGENDNISELLRDYSEDSGSGDVAEASCVQVNLQINAPDATLVVGDHTTINCNQHNE